MNGVRFYLYDHEQDFVDGPYAWDQIQEFHPEALVCVSNGSEWWPRRRWQPDGTLSVSNYEHAKAWWWVLITTPGIVYMFFPSWWRFESFVGWSLLMCSVMLMLALSRKDFPRFANQDTNKTSEEVPPMKPRL
jgi:hypothetical protein